MLEGGLVEVGKQFGARSWFFGDKVKIPNRCGHNGRPSQCQEHDETTWRLSSSSSSVVCKRLRQTNQNSLCGLRRLYHDKKMSTSGPKHVDFQTKTCRLHSFLTNFEAQKYVDFETKTCRLERFCEHFLTQNMSTISVCLSSKQDSARFI